MAEASGPTDVDPDTRAAPDGAGAPGTPLRLVVADDEPVALRRLVRLLGEEPGVAVVAACGGGREALAAARAHRPDVVLLDVEMPGLDGLAVARHLAAEHEPAGGGPAVVFVTAYDAHAVEAFRVRAVDYVLKPLDRARVREAVAHARRSVWLAGAARRAAPERAAPERAAPERAALPGPGPARGTDPERVGPARLTVRDGHAERFVAVRDIVFVESWGNYARVHTHAPAAAPQRVLHRGTMEQLAAALAPHGFVRVHRAAIVNVARVAGLRPRAGGRCEAVLDTGGRLRVSRTHRAALRAALGAGVGGTRAEDR